MMGVWGRYWLMSKRRGVLSSHQTMAKTNSPPITNMEKMVIIMSMLRLTVMRASVREQESFKLIVRPELWYSK